MSLTSLQATTEVKWGEEKTNTGFQSAKVQPASLNAVTSIVSGSLTNYRVHAARYTIAAGATQTLDLTSLTNLVNESITFVGCQFLQIKSNGQPFTVGPNATNGLTFGISGTTPKLVVKANGHILLADGDITAVSGSAKRIDIINTGASSGTFDVVIGGTV